MPAVSKKQQKFFGIVRAIQKGEMAPTTPETAKAAADMKKVMSRSLHQLNIKVFLIRWCRKKN